jgi:hypothetical protein
MADTVTTTLGTFATDDIGGVHYQRVKVVAGADGTATDVSAAAPLPITIAAPTTFYHGQTTVTTAGTEVALAASQAILSGVTVKALHANTGWIYVGKNPVTSSTGFVLDAGESIFVEVDNINDIYIDSSVNGEGVSWVAS